MPNPVLALRELLEQRFPGAQPIAPGGSARPVATGFSALDALLPEGGLPRGRLTHWSAGGGATAVLRHACVSVAARSERAAWVDGMGTVSGACWAEGPLLFRPEGAVAALECAEELLRSGGFALVVLALKEQLGEDAAYVRLSRVAREGGGALVLLGPRSPVAALRVRSRIRPEAYTWASDPFGGPAEAMSVRVQVRAAAAGWSGETQLELGIAAPSHRLALEPSLPDRRGVKPPAPLMGEAAASAGRT